MIAVDLDYSGYLIYIKDDKKYLLLYEGKPISLWPSVGSNGPIVSNVYVDEKKKFVQDFPSLDENPIYYNVNQEKNILNDGQVYQLSFIQSIKVENDVYDFIKIYLNYLNLDETQEVKKYYTEDIENPDDESPYYEAFELTLGNYGNTSIVFNKENIRQIKTSKIDDYLAWKNNDLDPNFIIGTDKINNDFGNSEYVILKHFELYSSQQEEKEESEDEKYDGYVTPFEYYELNGNETTENVSNFMDLTTENSGNEKPTWFWLNTFQNWGTFKLDRDNITRFYLWNGKNGFTESLEDLMNLSADIEKRSLIETDYMYDDSNRFFPLKQVNVPIHISNESYKSFNSYIYFTCVLTYDSKYSSKTNSFQTIRRNDLFFTTYDIEKTTKNYMLENTHQLIEIGCPLVYRNVSHELVLVYKFYFPRNGSGQISLNYTSTPGITNKEAVKFYNEYLQKFFGDGSEKTIEHDWKHHTYAGEKVEAEEIKNEEQNMLFNEMEVNTYINNEDPAKLSFNVNRIQLEMEDSTIPDFSERWE